VGFQEVEDRGLRQRGIPIVFKRLPFFIKGEAEDPGYHMSMIEIGVPGEELDFSIIDQAPKCFSKKVQNIFESRG
jgi:hypothetical protein